MTFAGLDNQLLLQGPALVRLTEEEFYDLCQHNPSLRLERTADHNIIAMPPVGSESSRKSGEVYGQLWFWNRQHQLGYAYDSSAGFTMPDGSVRSPDAAWLSKEKFEQLTDAQRQKFPPVCPEFVVEVRSPSDGLATLRHKMEDYLAKDVQLGFLLDPTAQTATIYRPEQALEEFAGFGQELSGEPVLPGFVLDLKPLQ